MVNKDLGMVTAYAYAVSKGYTGTEEEFAALMADYAAVGQRAEQAATAAAASATAASGSASDSAASATAAEGSATAAATSAGNASQAAQSASQSATAAAGSATAAGQSATAAAGSATTAGNKAAEAAGSALAAAGSATSAGASATAAQTAQTAAETAQTAAEDAQGAAEDAAESVEGKAAQIDQNTEDISLLKSHLEDTTGNESIKLSSGYIATNGSTVNVNTVVPHATYYHAAVPCAEGDFFTISAVGGSTPYAWTFVDANGAKVLDSGANVTVTNFVVSAPANAVYLVINDNGSTSRSYKGILAKKLIDDNSLGIYEDFSFTISRASGSGYRTIPLPHILRKGMWVSVTNNASVMFDVKFLSGDMGETGDFVSLTRSGTATATKSIVLTEDAFFIKVYLNSGCDFTFTYGQNINRDDGDTTGLIVKNNGVYSYNYSSRYQLFKYYLKAGTYKVITYLPVTTETNPLAYAISKTDNLLGLEVVADSGIINIQSEQYVTYSVTMPFDGYLFVSQSVTFGSDPYISSVRQNYGYEEMKKMALKSGLVVTNGRIERGTQGVWNFGLYGYAKSPYIVRAKVSSDASPYIVVTGDNTYRHIRIDFYNSGNDDYSEIRIPPLEVGRNTYYNIQVALPTGSYIDYLEFAEESTLHRRATYSGIDVNAHLGFTSLSPENTMPGFIAAYQSGYDAIICNPKLTHDDIWVCCHDATINRTARNDDGTNIESTITIADTDYEDLLDYDFGIAYSTVFAGTRIPKLEDFLKLCALTGIRPIFSMHQNDNLSDLRSLVNKYGQLKDLVLKIPASTSVFADYYALFGDIYMYDFVINDPTNVLTNLITNIQATEQFGTVRMMIDVPVTYMTAAVASQITSAGLLCGVYDLQDTLYSRYKSFVGLGVTQFTDDRYPVTGLKWM